MQLITKRNSRRIIIAGFLVIILVVVLLLVHSHDRTQNQASSTSSTVTHQPTEVAVTPTSITYPSSWLKATQISKVEADNGVIAEATQTTSKATVTIRQLTGNLAKNFAISALPDQVVSSLSSNINGFVLLSKGLVQIQPYTVAQIDYTTKTADSRTITNKMFIIPTPHNTYYITYSDANGNLSSYANDITDINDSAVTYIKSQNS